MSYAAQQDLYNQFGQSEIDTLADRNGDGQPDAGVIDGVLAAADATIDAYLQARYTLPLQLTDGSTPLLLTRLACDLARYDLYGDAVPDIVQTRRDAAIKMLQAISTGQATIGVSETIEPVSADAPKIAGGKRKFDDSSLGDYTHQPAMPYR